MHAIFTPCARSFIVSGLEYRFAWRSRGDVRDQVVDTIRSWSEKTDLPLRDILGWTEIHSGTFNKWTRCYGKAYEHNGKVPRDHWLTDQEKQALIQYLPLAFGHNAINPGGLGAEPSRTPSILCLFIYETKPNQRLRYLG